jgi:hypothetical protein
MISMDEEKGIENIHHALMDKLDIEEIYLIIIKIITANK